MMEAAEKVELKPETLLHVPCHIAGADAVIEQALRGDQPFLCGTAVPNAIDNSEGRDHRGIRFRPLDHRLRPWSLSREIVPPPARDAAAGSYASPPVSLPPGNGHSHTLQGERHDFLATMAATPREV